MSLSNVFTAVNGVQTDTNNQRGRGGSRRRGERGGSHINQSNQNDGNHSLQDLKCYQCGKKGHISRNCPDRSEKKNKDNFNSTTGNSEARANSNSNQNRSSEPNPMFVKYIRGDPIEITHNQFFARISGIA